MTAFKSWTEMPLVFVGARVVGLRCLEALLARQANVVGLLTLDESKADMTTAFRSFDDLVAKSRVQCRKFTNLKDPELLSWIQDLQPHLGIVAGVSQLIPPQILALPRLGFIGLHPTLLPQGRGRAPIPWALIKGLTKTGVSWFYCEPGADTGDLLAQAEVPVYYEDVSATLGARTDEVASQLLLESMPGLAAGQTPRLVQDESLAEEWPRRRPEDGRIDWDRTRREIYDWVRALTHPYPGAFTAAGSRRLFIWSARESLDERTGHPGEVLAVLPHGVLVATAAGNLLLTRVQWENDAEVDAAQAGLQVGQRLGGA